MDPFAIDSAGFLAGGNTNIEFVFEGQEDGNPMTVDGLKEVLKHNLHNEDEEIIVYVEEESKHNATHDSAADGSNESVINLQNRVQSKRGSKKKVKIAGNHSALKKVPKSGHKKIAEEKSKNIPEIKEETAKPSNDFLQKRDFNESFLSFVDREIQKTMVRQSNFEKFMNDCARKAAITSSKSLTATADESDTILPPKRLCTSPGQEPPTENLAVKPIKTLLPTSQNKNNQQPRILSKSKSGRKLDILQPIIPPVSSLRNFNDTVSPKPHSSNAALPAVQKRNIETNQNLLYVMGSHNALGNSGILANQVMDTPQKVQHVAIPVGVLPNQPNTITLAGGLAAGVPVGILSLPGHSETGPTTTFILAPSASSSQVLGAPVNPILLPSQSSLSVAPALPVISGLPVITDVRSVSQYANSPSKTTKKKITNNTNTSDGSKQFDMKILSKTVKEKAATVDKINSGTEQKTVKMVIEGEEIEMMLQTSLNESEKVPKDSASLEKKNSETTTKVHAKEANICYVPSCTIRKGEKVYLFGVPLDQNLLKIWDTGIGRTDKRLASSDVICEKHFSSEDIVFVKDFKDPKGEAKPKLKKGAIPCLSYHKNCCVPKCDSDKGRMYKFPILNEPNLQLWLYLIKDPKLRNLPIHELLKHRVCHRHFDQDCFERNGDLVKTAAPTLNMPASISVPENVENSKPKLLGSTWGIFLKCVFPNCDKPLGPASKVFKFPRYYDKCKEWLIRCERPDLIKDTLDGTYQQTESLGIGVCQEHFELGDYDGPVTDRLKFTAVPKDLHTKRPLKTNPETTIDLTISDSPENSNNTQESNSRRRCIYLNCPVEEGNDIQLFSFPKDVIKFKMWLEACGYQSVGNIKNDDRFSICSKHFTPDMFFDCNSVIKTLKLNAVPVYSFETIKSNAKDTKNKLLFPNTDVASVKLPAEETFVCAVLNCVSVYAKDNPKKQDHAFPDPKEDAERFDLWMKLVSSEALDKLSPQTIKAKYMVCEKHFESFFYKNGPKKTGQLSFCAVPTLHLTNDHKWLFKTDYYKNKIVEYVKSVITASATGPENPTTQCLPLRVIDTSKPKNTCELLRNRLNFPGLGICLKMGSSELPNKKQTYDVYRYHGDARPGYSLVDQLHFSGSLQIHTAIIIEDDDEVERQVLQDILDKRRKFIKSSIKHVDIEA